MSFQPQDWDPEIAHSARSGVSCWTLSWKGPGDTRASSCWGCNWGGHMQPVGFLDLDLKSAWQRHCRTPQFEWLLRDSSTVGHYLSALEERKVLPECMVSAQFSSPLAGTITVTFFSGPLTRIFYLLAGSKHLKLHKGTSWKILGQRWYLNVSWHPTDFKKQLLLVMSRHVLSSRSF